jgi:hypothetical protein
MGRAWLVVVAMMFAGCAAPQPIAFPATATSAAMAAPATPAATLTPPAATWTPVATLAPQAYLDAMREAASSMRLAAKTLEHTDTVLTRHITDTVPSREVMSLGTTDTRIIRAARGSLQAYRDHGLLTPALSEAVTALDSADSILRLLAAGEGDPGESLLAIQDAQVQLATALADLREELIAHGVPAAQADQLVH